MTIGLLSFVFDLLFLSSNISFVFPMFTLISLISSIYFREEKSVILLNFVLYIFLVDVIIYPLFFLILSFIFLRFDNIRFNTSDYLYKISFLLLLFDSLLFILTFNYDFNILIHKWVLSLPINIFYSIIVYKIKYVLKNRNSKYKLV